MKTLKDYSDPFDAILEFESAVADYTGAPYCVTVDYQTLEDNTVTIRDRDTMEQKRIDINEVVSLMY